jgi:hypothetical protein
MSSVETDPFAVLNLPPTADREEIKRTYKRMALKYHPDVVTDRNASAEERRKANHAFAKINWAYAQLSCKNEESSKTSSASPSTGSSPPHRRTSTLYNGNPNQQASTAPHVRGDSFVSLKDLFESAAIGAARAAWGGGGNFRESTSRTYNNPNHASTNWRNSVNFFKDDAIGTKSVAAGDGGISCDTVETLEVYVDGHSAGKKEGAQLQILLKTGPAKQVGMEMDDTELVVQQLNSEREKLGDELAMRQANHKTASTYLYLEKKELDEVKKRKQVVEENLEWASSRLLALQTRFKQLVTIEHVHMERDDMELVVEQL